MISCTFVLRGLTYVVTGTDYKKMKERAIVRFLADTVAVPGSPKFRMARLDFNLPVKCEVEPHTLERFKELYRLVQQSCADALEENEVHQLIKFLDERNHDRH
jgi:hypothetical protein